NYAEASDVGFTYDEEVNGVGRLTTMRDGSGTTRYGYDGRGDLISVQTTRGGITHTMGYAYNGADQVMQITYPSGRTVDYARNALGHVQSVTTTGSGETQTLATNIIYAPFGPITGLSFGNGVPMNRQLDLDYRLAANIHQGVLEQGFSFDAADNISVIDDDLEMHRNQSFAYDALDRLTGAQGVYGRHGYGYDAGGNRVSLLTDTQSESYSYTPDSHRLRGITGSQPRSFAYDANGNTTETEGFTFGYRQNNRLSEMRRFGVPQVRYTYNGRGERVKKEASGEGVYFHYDPNGQLLAETDAQGQTLKEYLYLEGMPLAVVAAKTTPSGVVLQGQDPGRGQTFRLTLEPQTRTLSLEGLGDGDGAYRIAPEHWRETSETLLASHTTPSRARLKVKLVRTADSSTGTLTLTRPPRKGHYRVNGTGEAHEYTGLDERTGKAVNLTVDEDTRTLTLREEGEPPRTLTVVPEHWRLNQTKKAKHLRFGYEAEGLRLHGALHLGKDGQVGGHLKLREGKWQKSRYALTALPTPSGPAALYFIHTDHLGTPQILTDETQQVVWAADYRPFGEATLTKDNVTFNLRFPGQYYDSESGLHYNYYRDYGPSVGRYIIQSDPIGLGGGLNTY
ncbi:MAG: RHS domain-containing protein, partial [bacterium]